MVRMLSSLAFIVLLISCGDIATSATKNGVEAPSVDCSEAYGGEPATCSVVECLPKYQEFIGEWKGPFEAYDQASQGFCPFDNTVSYSKSDCLRNDANGEIFIIGRRHDIYKQTATCKAKEKPGLLITGIEADGKPFLRTIDEEGLNSYQIEYKDNAASMSVWSLSIASEHAPMTFTTIDGRDWTQPGVHKRNVVVTLSIGDRAAPQWEGVIVRGYHILQPE